MTSRERWTIYPLLFLALMMAARDKIAAPDEATYRVLKCQELIVQDFNGQKLVQLGNAAESQGFLAIYDGREVTEGNARRRRVEVSSNELGGFLRATGGENVPEVFLGFREKQEFAGLMGLNASGDLIGDDQSYRSQTWGSHFTLPK